MRKYVKENIKNNIINELIDLGLSLDGNSFDYWLELLLAVYNEKFDSFNMRNFYLYLGEIHRKKYSQIERILRYGSGQMRERIKEKYGIRTKITNATIIKLFQLQIF